MKNKLNVILKNRLYVILESVMSVLISSLRGSNFGRRILFSSYPKNHLILSTTNEGLKFIVNSSDKVIGKAVYSYQRAYDSQHLDQAFDILKVSHKTLLIDIGANIGTIGIYAVSKGLAARCIAFEPEPRNFQLLENNVFLNRLEDKMKCYNFALSDQAVDVLEFELSPVNYGDHRVRVSTSEGLQGEAERKVIKVPSATLDSFFENEELDNAILFMDTQGFEGHILSGAKDVIDKAVPIVTEFWPYGLSRSGGLEKFLDALDKASYSKIYDLRYPDAPFPFSRETFVKIAAELEEDGRFTDLLITT